MSLELIVTSAPRGLKPNASGFCTVAATAGMSRQVMMKLEALSGYEFHFNLSDAQAPLNPVDYAHTRVTIGGETSSVLSRIAFCGADYSGRTNKIAHHFILHPREQHARGPAWMMHQMARGVFRKDWQGEPKEFPPQPLEKLQPAEEDPTPGGGLPAIRRAKHWQALARDAGWAGVLAKAFREGPDAPAFVVFNPGTDLLPLFEESLSILPPAERWSVGFATYYTSLPSGCHYHWRGILAGSTAAREMARFPNAVVIDLRQPLPRAEDNVYTEAARNGLVVEAPRERPEAALEARQDPLQTPAFFRFDRKKLRTAAKEKPSPAGGAAPPSLPSDAGRSLRYGADKGGRLGPDSLTYWLAGVAGFLLLANAFTLLSLLSTRSELRRARDEKVLLARALAAATAAPREQTPPPPPIGRKVPEPPATKTAVPRGGTPAPKPPATREVVSGGGTPAPKHGEEPPPKPPVPPDTKKAPEVKPAVPEPPKRPPIEAIEPEEAKGDVKVAAVVKDDEKEIQFDAGDWNLVLRTPATAKKKTLPWIADIDKDGNGLLIKHMDKAGWDQPFLHCKRDPQSGHLAWEVPDELRKGYASRLQYFVLSVMDPKTKTIYQCMRERQELAGAVTLLYKDDGSPAGAEEQTKWTFSYPWPEVLLVKHPELGGGKPQPLKQLVTRDRGEIMLERKLPRYKELVPKLKGGEEWRDVANAMVALRLVCSYGDPADKAAREQVTISLTVPPRKDMKDPPVEPQRFFNALDDRVKELNARLEDAKSAKHKLETDLDNYVRSLLTKKQKDEAPKHKLADDEGFMGKLKLGDGPRQEIKKLRNQIQGQQNKQNELQGQVHKAEQDGAKERNVPEEICSQKEPLAPVEFLDPWGVPVAKVTPGFLRERPKP